MYDQNQTPLLENQDSQADLCWSSQRPGWICFWKSRVCWSSALSAQLPRKCFLSYLLRIHTDPHTPWSACEPAILLSVQWMKILVKLGGSGLQKEVRCNLFTVATGKPRPPGWLLTVGTQAHIQHRAHSKHLTVYKITQNNNKSPPSKSGRLLLHCDLWKRWM